MVAGSRSHAWVESALRSGRTVELEHRGHSMSPALRDGDVLSVAPVGRLLAGDVVVAQSGALLIAHRLITIDRDFVVLRGDSVARPDPSIAASMVIGRVTAVQRGSLRLTSLRRRPSVARWLARAFAVARRLANATI